MEEKLTCIKSKALVRLDAMNKVGGSKRKKRIITPCETRKGISTSESQLKLREVTYFELATFASLERINHISPEGQI